HCFRQRGESANIAEQHRDGSFVAAKPDRLRRLGDALCELWRKEALEVAARQHLALDALAKLLIFDGDSRDARERDAELEVVVAEAMRCGDVVDVENAQ